MASLARRHPVVAATGIGLLFAVAIFAALCAFLVLLFALMFGWLPGVLRPALLWTIGCLGVMAASVFLIRRFAGRDDHAGGSA